MPVGTNTEVSEIKGWLAEDYEFQKPAGDISGGVEKEVGDVTAVTIYFTAAGQVNITVEASPNGGDDWFELPESPVQFDSSGDNAIRTTYELNRIRLTGSNGTAVKAIAREMV